MNKRLFAEFRKRGTAAITLALFLVPGGATHTQAQAPQNAVATNTERHTMANESKFICNPNALNPAERAQHKQLTAKLIAARKEVVETVKGYEFQFNSSMVSVAELAGWVEAEAKCCPFFDFHIDLERRGNLVCLRLTGEEGIKPFIQAGFQVPAK
jgi:hypothetical protein